MADAFGAVNPASLGVDSTFAAGLHECAPPAQGLLRRNVVDHMVDHIVISAVPGIVGIHGALTFLECWKDVRRLMSMWDNTKFELIDPRELLLDKNARTIVDIESEDPELVASVKLHGVMVPLIANPAADGRRRVRDGHSRALAAILAVDEHPVVPVLVTECTDERIWIRLRDQWIANEVRRGFTPGDKARIFEQMALVSRV